MIIKGYIFGILYALVCIGIAFVSYKLGMPKKYSRKMVHILVGFEWVILSHYMGPTYHFLIVCIFFLILLAVSYFKNLLPMISSDSDNAPGTVYYAVAMTVMAIICIFEPRMMHPFGIGVFCTSLGDGFAAVVGQLIRKLNPKIYKEKSLFGAIANFIFSFGAAHLITVIFALPIEIWQCVMIALLSVGIELISPSGLDNIAITLSTSFLAYAFIYFTPIVNYIAPIVITPFIIALVLSKNVLTRTGVLLAVLLDLLISLLLGNFGFVLLLAFLVASVLVDKIKKRRKDADSISKKSGDARDGAQVLANGLIPVAVALIFGLTLNKAFLVAYVAALAEAFADTAASGLGVFSKSTFDIFRMKKCKQGLSGGMSWIGTGASLVGAIAISSIALAFGVLDLKLSAIAALSAFLGAIFDSFLGSLVQVKYKCSVCSEITEKEYHCNKKTEKHSGFYFFDNDVVNLFSTAFAAILAAVLTTIISIV